MVSLANSTSGYKALWNLTSRITLFTRKISDLESMVYLRLGDQSLRHLKKILTVTIGAMSTRDVHGIHM